MQYLDRRVAEGEYGIGCERHEDATEWGESGCHDSGSAIAMIRL
jgi:hypothetical protein